MTNFEDEWRPIFINGVQRMATKSRIPDLVKDFDGLFFVDSAERPRQRTAQHRLSRGATAHLEKGGRVKSAGNWYSLKPAVT